MTVDVDSSRTRAALRHIHTAIHAAAQLVIRDTMQVAVDEAKATKLWQDGTPAVTRGTIHAEEGILSGQVVAGGAAHFLEGGTRAHAITAVNGRALRFHVNGQVVIRRSVQHPGTEPRPFMREARDRAAFAATFAADIHVGHAVQSVA